MNNNLRAIGEHVMFDMGNRGAALGMVPIPPMRAIIMGYLDEDQNILNNPNDPNHPPMFYAISIRDAQGIYVPHQEENQWLGVAPEFIRDIMNNEQIIVGGRKNRKSHKNRKNRKGSRKNRKASRKGSRKSRKNRK